MLAGPIFSREALTAPRQLRHYLIRSGYVAALLLLMYTAAQVTFGWQQVRNIGDLARFGGLLFQIFALVQLSLVLFLSLLFTAGNVAQEKDRQTLILLLMTDLHNREIVLGKLAASLLTIAVPLLASVPAFLLIHLLGGVSLDQILWTLALCAVAAVAAGTWGTLVAFWREKTFQTLAISVLGAILFLGTVEAVVGLAGPDSWVGTWAAAFNPYRAMARLLDPLSAVTGPGAARVSASSSVLAMVGLAAVLSVVTTARLRLWNPTRTVFTPAQSEAGAAEAGRSKPRPIWRNPVIWREIRTRAYGRKIAFIKLGYVVLALMAAFYLSGSAGAPLVLGMISPAGFAFVGLGLVSLILINAQAVTALTSERDMKTLELLMMTDVTAREFVYGKLGGVLYNAKEMILIPLALIGYYAATGTLTWENLVYVILGFLVLVGFAAMLGLHAGLSFEISRSAIANSLGTIFFLFVGIFIFLMMLVEARSSFFLQFQSFFVFIVVGSIALYASLAHRNPSMALKIAAGVLPFLTFYAITEFLLAGTLGVCLAISAAYGFTTLAMLVPAVSEFDVALGRTTFDQG